MAARRRALLPRARALLSACLLLSLLLAPGARAGSTATPGGGTPTPAASPPPQASPAAAPVATASAKASTAAPNATGSPAPSAAPTKGGPSPRAIVSPPLQSGLGVAGWYPLVTYPLWDRMQLQVNVANGNLLAEATDVAIKGTGHDLVVGRVWQSLSAGTSTPYGIWNNWAMSTGQDVQLLGAGTSTVTFVDGTGAQYTFTQNGSAYTSPPGIDATLVKNGDGSFTLTFHATGERYTFAMTTGSQGTIPSLTADADQDGNAIAFAYNTGLFGYGQLETITDTQGRQVALTWDQLDTQLQQLADPTGRTWRYGYGPGSYGNLLTYTDPNGKQTLYGYNASTNDLTQITDPNSNVTKLAYDRQHRVTSITFGQGSGVAGTYSFTYNASTTVVTDPNNHQTTYAFDGQLRVTKITDALSNSAQFGWTSDNHVQQYTDAKNQVFAYGYNANNDLASIQLPTGATTTWAYNDSNHPYYPTSTTDPQGNATTIHYTAAGDPDVVTNQLPNQNRTQLFYNPNGTVDHRVDALGNTTSYQYDPRGNLTKIVPPSYPSSQGTQLGPTTIVPDALSRPQSVTDGNGHQTTYTFDPLDRITNIQYPDGSIAYGVDNDGNVTSMADGNGTTTYQFDARNRQTQKTLPSSLGGGTFQYGWDGANNLTSYADAGGAVTYHYNAADELDWLRDPSGAQTSFQYDPNHHRTSTAYPNGVTMARSYDNSQRLSNTATTSAGATLVNLTYSYTNPASGRDTNLAYTITESDAPGVGPFPTRNFTTTQTYDQLNRLTQWLVKPTGGGTPIHDYTYQFDGNSNRTQIVADPDVANPPPNPKTALVYNPANELLTTSVYNGQGVQQDSSTWTYDAAGNQTDNTGYPHLNPPSPPLSITYNQHNQTTSVTDVYQHPVAMTWTGPGQSERASADWSNVQNPTDPTKPAEFGHTTYTSSALGLMSEADATGTTYYTRDPAGLPVSERTPGGTYYYVFDGLGDVVAIVDAASGAVVVLYDPCPTGNPAGNGYQQPGTQLSSHNPLQRRAALGGISDWGTHNVLNAGFQSTDGGFWTQVSLRARVRAERGRRAMADSRRSASARACGRSNAATRSAAPSPEVARESAGAATAAGEVTPRVAQMVRGCRSPWPARRHSSRQERGS